MAAIAKFALSFVIQPVKDRFVPEKRWIAIP
jgi:hypothetical protein